MDGHSLLSYLMNVEEVISDVASDEIYVSIQIVPDAGITH